MEIEKKENLEQSFDSDDSDTESAYDFDDEDEEEDSLGQSNYGGFNSTRITYVRPYKHLYYILTNKRGITKATIDERDRNKGTPFPNQL